jgi:hypothetical protein
MTSTNQDKKKPKSFSQFLKNFNLVNSSLIVGTVMAPLIGSKLADIAPPGHDNPALLSVFQLLIVLGSFLFFDEKRNRLLRRTSIAALSLCLCSLIVYLGLVENFTYLQPTSGNRIIRGIEMAAEAPQILHEAGCPSTELSECGLDVYGNEYSLMWKNYESVSRNRRFVLSIAWIIVFSLLALGVASFALLI